MEIKYSFTETDYKKYINSDFNLISPKRRILIRAINVVIVFLILISLFFNDLTFTLTLSAIYALFVYLQVFQPRLMKKQLIKKLKKSDLLEGKTIRLDDDKMHIIDKNTTFSHLYSNIEKIDVIKDAFILILFKSQNSFVVPISAFKDHNEKVDFINKIKTSAKIL